MRARFGNNTDMNKYIDAFFILAAIILSSFAVTGFFTDDIAVKAAVSVCCGVLFALILAAFARNPSNKGASYNEFVTYCIMQQDKAIEDIYAALSLPLQKTQTQGLYTSSQGALWLNVKFAKPSKDFAVTVYRQCLSLGISKVTVLCSDYDKTALSFVHALPDVKIKFKTLKPLYKAAKKQKLLSSLPIKIKRQSALKSMLPAIFSAKNSYRFLLTSAVLFLFSLLTPMRTYYITMASVALLLAVVSRIYAQKKDGNRPL